MSKLNSTHTKEQSNEINPGCALNTISTISPPILNLTGSFTKMFG